jgi:hypothetical protein
MVEPDRTQMTIWRMRSAFCIPKATIILSEYIILIVLSLREWLRERASILRSQNVHCLSHYLTKFPAELSVLCGVSPPDVTLF